MARDTKRLEKIMELKRRLDTDWEKDLERVNMWDEMKPIYDRYDNRRISNIIVAFIVLCYDASSEFLELKKDRLDTKKFIMSKLAGPEGLLKDHFLDALFGDDGGPVDTAIQWYINTNKDTRFNSIISKREFQAKANMMASGNYGMDEMKEIGDMMKLADYFGGEADKLVKELENEFATYDSELNQEKKVKLTDRLKNDKTNWELFILDKRYKDELRKRLEEQENAAS